MLVILFWACVEPSDDSKGIPWEDRPRQHDSDGDTAADGGDTAEDDSDTGGGDDSDSDTGADSDTGGADSDTGADTDELEARAEACHADIEGWSPAWQQLEEQVLDLVNAQRAQGADCGSYGSFDPVGPLEMDPEARCAARYHSLWMAETGNFAHESPGGDLGADFWTRMANAGYRGSPYGENIAAGYTTARDVMAGWMASDGHCSNIMAPSPTNVGVGYYAGGSYGAYWTQDFGY